MLETAYVWIESKNEGWVPAKVIKRTDKIVVVDDPELGHVEMPVDQVKNAHLEEHEDMVQMNDLSEASILYNLRQRFEKDLIYTNISQLLICINPYQWLSTQSTSTRQPEKLCSDQIAQDYFKALSANMKMPAHIFNIAHSSFRNLKDTDKDQSVIICGESGSGKTEATKHVLKYLTHVSGKDDSIGQKIVFMQPLIEAFGNAKTVRNNNSSRFGKWSELFWSKKHKIVGMKMIKYLLEKSRVVGQARIDGERNYHIFYQVVKCLGKDPNNPYHLSSKCEDYSILVQGKCTQLPARQDFEDMDADVVDFEQVQKSMDILNFSQETKDVLFRVVSAILHLGNIRFVANPDDDPVSKIPTLLQGTESLEIAAQLLKVDKTALTEAFLFDVVTFPDGKTISSPVVPIIASSNRDALCKLLYSGVFDWIFKQANDTLGDIHEECSTIGLLDIFGFEKFESNFFEQFCINFANEKLQNHFIEFMITMEVQEYAQEGIEIASFDTVDNSSTLALIEEKDKGIMYVTLDLTKQKNAKDETFLSMLNDRFRSHPMYVERAETFIIKHYAEDVEYSGQQWLEKNRDKVSGPLNDVVIQSSDDFISGLQSMSGKQAAKQCVGMQFRDSLASLLAILQETDPHFVRCLKPNSKMRPQFLQGLMVTKQLRYLGVEGICRIRHAGYPMRFSYEQFIKHYPIWFSLMKPGDDPQQVVTKLLYSIASKDQVRAGKSKIFMKSDFLDHVDQKYSEKIYRLRIAIQLTAKTYLAKNLLTFLKDCKTYMEKQVTHMTKISNSKPITGKEIKKAAIICEAASRYFDENPLTKDFHYSKQYMMNLLQLQNYIKLEASLQKTNYDSIDMALDLLEHRVKEARTLLGTVQNGQSNMYRKSSSNLLKKAKSVSKSKSPMELHHLRRKSVINLKLDDAVAVSDRVSAVINQSERRIEELTQLKKEVTKSKEWSEDVQKTQELLELAQKYGVATSTEIQAVQTVFVELGGKEEILAELTKIRPGDDDDDIGSFTVDSPKPRKKSVHVASSATPSEGPSTTWLEADDIEDDYALHRSHVCSVASLIWGLSAMNPWLVLCNSSEDLRGKKNGDMGTRVK